MFSLLDGDFVLWYGLWYDVMKSMGWFSRLFPQLSILPMTYNMDLCLVCVLKLKCMHIDIQRAVVLNNQIIYYFFSVLEAEYTQCYTENQSYFNFTKRHLQFAFW